MANPSDKSVRSRTAKLVAASRRGELTDEQYRVESNKIDESVLYLLTRLGPDESLAAWRKRAGILEHLELAVESGKLVGRPRVLDDPEYAASILDTDAQLALEVVS